MASQQPKIKHQSEVTSSLKAEENVIPDLLGNSLDKEYMTSGEYMRSLRDRLSQCVQRNNRDIQESVKLLKELSDVSDGMHLAITTSTNTPKIKNLIRSFETIGTANTTNLGLDKQTIDTTEIRSLFLEFKTLNDDDLLRDCLMTFKSAKEKFEKVQSFFENMVGSGATAPSAPFTASPESAVPAASAAPTQYAPPAPQTKKLSPSNSVSPTSSVSPSLRDKIEAFNKALGDGKDTSKYFEDCFSTRDPATEASVEEMKPSTRRSRTQSGYEGDIDSEADQADSTRG